MATVHHPGQPGRNWAVTYKDRTLWFGGSALRQPLAADGALEWAFADGGTMRWTRALTMPEFVQTLQVRAPGPTGAPAQPCSCVLGSLCVGGYTQRCPEGCVPER